MLHFLYMFLLLIILCVTFFLVVFGEWFSRFFFVSFLKVILRSNMVFRVICSLIYEAHFSVRFFDVTLNVHCLSYQVCFSTPSPNFALGASLFDCWCCYFCHYFFFCLRFTQVFFFLSRFISVLISLCVRECRVPGVAATPWRHPPRRTCCLRDLSLTSLASPSLIVSLVQARCRNLGTHTHTHAHTRIHKQDGSAREGAHPKERERERERTKKKYIGSPFTYSYLSSSSLLLYIYINIYIYMYVYITFIYLRYKYTHEYR
ncbi:unnamed protein product [Ixodes pacificus]